MGCPRHANQIYFHEEELCVTTHAIQRFIERFAETHPRGEKLKKPLRTIRKLINISVKMEIDPKHRLRRLLNNQCVPAEYWIHPSGLRFVIVDDYQDERKVLITVEIARELTEEAVFSLIRNAKIEKDNSTASRFKI